MTQSHIDSIDTNGNTVAHISTTTCVHFKFITGEGTPYTSLAAPDTPESLADADATARELFPGAFGQERPRFQAPDYPMSAVSSTLSSPSMISLPPINNEDTSTTPMSTLGPTSTDDQRARTITRTSDIISISSDEELTDDDDDADDTRIPFELYTQGNGLLFVNDMSTGLPTNRVVADLQFDRTTKAQCTTRFYVVTVGTDVGIFDNVYVFHFIVCFICF